MHQLDRKVIYNNQSELLEMNVMGVKMVVIDLGVSVPKGRGDKMSKLVARKVRPDDKVAKVTDIDTIAPYLHDRCTDLGGRWSGWGVRDNSSH